MKKQHIAVGAIALIALSMLVGHTHAQQSRGGHVIAWAPTFNNNPVNEPVIAWSIFDSELKVMVIWQVQTVPGGGFTEAPLRLEYAVGSLHPNPLDSRLVWDLKGPVPAPDHDDDEDPIPWLPLDPTVAAGFKATLSMGFLGAGVVFAPVDRNAFFVRTGTADPEFQPTPLHFADEVVRYTRLGIGATDGPFEGVTIAYLLATVDTFNSPNAVPNQIVLRRSGDNGTTWSNWLPAADGNGPVIGYVSAPRFHRPLLGAPLIAFSYADDEAEYIRVAAATDSASPAWSDAGLAVTPALPIGPTETYFDAAKNYVMGDFEIGPFTSCALSPDGNTMWVVYQDLAGPPVDGDADFDIFLMRGTRIGMSTAFSWGSPIRVNQDAPDVRADQFMPTMEVDEEGRLHIAWFDTRHSDLAPGAAGAFGLYYALGELDGGGNFTITEVELDRQIIQTSLLSNPNFIGDGIDLIVYNDRVYIVTPATSHPRLIQPIGIENLLLPPLFPTPPANEFISCYVVDVN